LGEERRTTKRRKQLSDDEDKPTPGSKTFQDILPQPVIPLPPKARGTCSGSSGQAEGPASPCRSDDVVSSVEQATLDTLPNAFGLFRRYFSKQLPFHDPESEVDLSGLSNVRLSVEEQPVDATFDPYPNESSFRLGEWHWNGGLQKSQASFKELIRIVGDSDFRPSDVRFTNWEKVNQRLACEVNEEGEWLDKDAGWRALPVTISVPFHRLTQNPGCRDYTVQFRYRPLISVIEEKLHRETDVTHFHYEPYELLWQAPEKQDPIRVYGELYTSQAFIDAHNTLQNSPGEPGCNLPRVVVALMFWSDGTHLTEFGDAKLWPLYMYFGNESKYRRSKPSCHLCEHVAYFETASVHF
jgi:hypothetical protein